jgi:hypothetical protein
MMKCFDLLIVLLQILVSTLRGMIFSKGLLELTMIGILMPIVVV